MPNESTRISSVEACKRCLGKGHFEIVISGGGYPAETQGPFRCLACKGTGRRKVRPTEPSRKIEDDQIDFIGESLI